jgi:hypothetical protein
MKYRVWDVNEKFFYKTSDVLISPNGLLKYYYKYDGDDPYWSDLYSNVIIQYCTGVKDIDGNEIYEGDLLSSNRFEKEKTIIREKVLPFENGGFYTEILDNPYFLGHQHLDIKRVEHFELKIAGNIINNL